MSRMAWILTVLVAVLLLVLWWFLLRAPTAAEIDQVEESIATVESQTVTLRNQAAQLRQVRERAPEAAAELAAADVLVPRDAALPSLLRQLQQAADNAGVRLSSVSPGRPASRETTAGTVSAIQLTLTLQGSYFQIVDFARRLEDPMLSGRGLTWSALSMTRAEHPMLSVSMSATVFARGEVGAVDMPPVEAEPPDVEAQSTEGPSEDDEEPTP